jgi:hypothetical protein
VASAPGGTAVINDRSSNRGSDAKLVPPAR